ncbi:MAG: transposase [Flavobacterium sp.]|nr:transposase [Aeromicrobium sp.]
MLGRSTQAYYKWLKSPVSQRDWDDAHGIDRLLSIHEDDPTLGYRFLTDELTDVGITASENRVWRLCPTAEIFASRQARSARVVQDDPSRRRVARRRRSVVQVTEQPQDVRRVG